MQLQARLKSEWDSYWNGQEAAEAARAKLKAVTGATMSVAEHEVQLQARKDEHAAKAERAMKLEAEYRAARMESQAAYEMIGFAQKALDDAKRTEVAYAGWQAAIDAAAGVPMPDDDKLAEADKAVAIAQAALERAGVIREAKRKQGRAAEHLKEAGKLRAEAYSLRDAARETDAVLSAMVDSPNLKVYAGRLVTSVPGRGEVLFHERSDGSRTKIACMEKLRRIRELNSEQLALIPIGQRQFNDLSPGAKKELIQWAFENNACIITAECTDDTTLTANPVTPNGKEHG